MTVKSKCGYCKKNIDASASRCPYCQGEYTPDQVAGRLKAANDGRNFGCGCLVAIVGGIFLWGILFPEKSANKLATAEPIASQAAADLPASATPVPAEPTNSLTVAQQNAARSALGYINMSGFSRKGLIHQLSSSSGEGYEVADATVAVDSLGIDWKEQAVRSAKDYLRMSGFSCKGLIQQLSSSSGENYTAAEARYGATQAGAC